MLVSEFDYPLPSERIAQHPAEPRDSARLMNIQTSAPLPQMISHHSVRDLPNLLRRDDLLIMNDTRVLRARMFGHKPTGGKVEALLLREIERNLWEVLLRPSARLKEGNEIIFRSDEIEVLGICEKRLDNTWHLRFKSNFDIGKGRAGSPSQPRGALGESTLPMETPNKSTFDIRDHLNDLGEVPLPPYNHAKADDPER
jgi:S-adenosylmethionine:tRNA ribosyltransferase-isomerase